MKRIVKLFGEEINVDKPVHELKFQLAKLFIKNRVDIRDFLGSKNIIFVELDEEEMINRQIIFGILESMVEEAEKLKRVWNEWV
ncbi:MAG: hypothetical protein ACRCYT_03445 [Cetobacterium sp.]